MITPGQIYRSCDPRGGPHIRIIEYRRYDARALVVDAATGKRTRGILAHQLHDTDTTKTGKPRRTGYALVPAAPETDQWNTRHPVGTPVYAWPATHDDTPLTTHTRTPAWTLGDGTPVVSVVGYAGGIALDHITIRTPDDDPGGTP